MNSIAQQATTEVVVGVVSSVDQHFVTEAISEAIPVIAPSSADILTASAVLYTVFIFRRSLVRNERNNSCC